MARKKPKRSLGAHPLFILLSIGIIAFFSLSIVRLLSSYLDLEDVVAEGQTNLAEAKKRLDKVEQEISILDTPFGIEAKLRDTYRVAKPGEEVIVILRKKADGNGDYDPDAGRGIFGVLKAFISSQN